MPTPPSVKSKSAGQLLSKWARKLSSSSLNEKEKEETSIKPCSVDVNRLLLKYHAEEDKFLKELEAMRQSITSPSSITSGEIVFSAGEDQEEDDRFSRSQSKLKMASMLGEYASPQKDLLGSFCHLMNYVLHLRRENRHLRKQVACLSEMRKIEQLKNDLLHAGCSCQPPSDPDQKKPPHGVSTDSYNSSNQLQPRPPSTVRPDGAVGRRASSQASSASCIRPPTPPKVCFSNTKTTNQQSTASSLLKPPAMRPRPKEKSSLPRPVSLTPNRQYLAPGPRSPQIREGGREELATPPSPLYALVGKKDADPMIASSCSADISSADTSSSLPPPPPLPPRLNRSSMHKKQLDQPPSDSDADQPVFSEVSLPMYQTEHRESHLRRSLIRRAGGPNQSAQCSSPSKPESPSFEPPSSPSLQGSVTSRSSILEKLGLRKKTRKPSTDTLSRTTLNSEVGQRTDSALTTSQELSVKALVKKRKRKISDSDSMASSDTSSKPYKTIDLPQAQVSYSKPLAMSVTVESIQRNLSPDYIAKMQQWQQKRSVSLKGQQTKRSWLRKPKLQRVDNEERYFERGDEIGRQDTVICIESPVPEEREMQFDTETMVERARSENNIHDRKNRRQLSSTLPKQGGIQSSIDDQDSPTLHESPAKSQSITFYEQRQPMQNMYLLPSSSASLTASFATLSEDSVFSAQDVAGMDAKACTDLLNHLVVLQEKNSHLFKQLREKSTEYACITQQLSVLEKEVRALKGRYRLDAALERLSSSRMSAQLVPVSMVADLEDNMREQDETLREVKQESYRTHQEVLEAHNREQLTSQKSLDQIEKLQKTNFQLLQSQMSQLSLYDMDMTRKLNLLPSYDAVYSFVSKLLRKYRHLRTVVLEKSSAASRLDLELLQTQSSLLLSHAQIERQKIELHQDKTKKELRRRHSFHGEDLLQRLISPQLTFYLPFKLHGNQLRKHLEQQKGDDELNNDTLDQEFLDLFENFANAVSLASIYEELPVRDTSVLTAPQSQSQYHVPRMGQRVGRPLLSSLHVLREGLQSDWVQDQRRPQSLIETAQAPQPRTRNVGAQADRSPQFNRYSHDNMEEMVTQQEMMRSPQAVRRFRVPQHQVITNSPQFNRLSQHEKEEYVSRFGRLTHHPSMEQEEMTPRFSQHEGDPRFHRLSQQEIMEEEEMIGQNSTIPQQMSGFRLGNNGHVRTIAEKFDVASAPNTPVARHVPHFLTHTRDNWIQSPVPRRTINQQQQQKLSDSSSDAPTERHYDTPPTGISQPNFGRVYGPSRKPNDYSVVTPPRSVTNESQPYAMTRLPRSGIQQPTARKLLFPRQNQQQGHSPTPSKKSAEAQYESLSSETSDNRIRATGIPRETRQKTSSLTNRQEQRRQFLYGYQPPPPPQRPTNVATGAMTSKATSTEETTAKANPDKKRTSWIMRFKSKK